MAMSHTARLTDKQKVGNPTSPRYEFAPPWESAQCREGRNRAARKPYASNAAGLYPIARALSGIETPSGRALHLAGTPSGPSRAARLPGTRRPRPKRRPSEPVGATPRAGGAVAAPASIAPPADPGPVPIAAAGGRCARHAHRRPPQGLGRRRLALCAVRRPERRNPARIAPAAGTRGDPSHPPAANPKRERRPSIGGCRRMAAPGGWGDAAQVSRLTPGPTVPVPFPRCGSNRTGTGPSRSVRRALDRLPRPARLLDGVGAFSANGSRERPSPEATVPCRRIVTRAPAASSTARTPGRRPSNTTRRA